MAHDFDNIIGKRGEWRYESNHENYKIRPEGFLVISGDDGLTLPMIYMGADGVISVIGQAYPKEFSDMVRYGLEGNQKAANKYTIIIRFTRPFIL